MPVTTEKGLEKEGKSGRAREGERESAWTDGEKKRERKGEGERDEEGERKRG